MSFLSHKRIVVAILIVFLTGCLVGWSRRFVAPSEINNLIAKAWIACAIVTIATVIVILVRDKMQKIQA